MADERIPQQKGTERQLSSAASFARAALSGWGLPSIEAPDFRKEPYPRSRPEELQSTLNFIFSDGTTTYAHPELGGLAFSEQEMHGAISSVLKADFNVFQSDHRQSSAYLDEGIVGLAADPAFISASRAKDRGAQMAIALKRIADARPPVPEAAPEPAVEASPEIDVEVTREETTQVVKASGLMEVVPLPAPSHDAEELSKELAYKLDLLLACVQAIPDNERSNLPGLIQDAFNDAYRRYWAIDKSETYAPFTHARNLIDAIHAYDTALRKLARLFPDMSVGEVEKKCHIGPVDASQWGQVLDLVALDTISRDFWQGYFPSSYLPAAAAMRALELASDLHPVDAGCIAFTKMPSAIRSDTEVLHQSLRDAFIRRNSDADPSLSRQEMERRSGEDLALMRELVRDSTLVTLYDDMSYADARTSGMVGSMLDELQAAHQHLRIPPRADWISAAAMRVVDGVREKQTEVESYGLHPAYNRPLACLLRSYSRESVMAFAEQMVSENTDFEFPPLRDGFDSELEAILPAGKDKSRLRQVAKSLNYFIYSMSSQEERQRIWGEARPGVDMAPQKKSEARPEASADLIGTIPRFTAFPLSASDILTGDGKPSDPKAVDSYGALMQKHDAFIQEIADAYPEQFRISSTMEVDDRKVHLCSPLMFEGYPAIPVYVENDSGSTNLVFYYRSKSQDSWRRYSGALTGIFWKGKSEHMQNADWRIQKALDHVYQTKPAVPAAFRDGSPISLWDISPGSEISNTRSADNVYMMIHDSEATIQNAMAHGQEPFDIKDKTNAPARIISYWWGGSREEAYGIYMNIMAVSENGKHLYCIAATEDGIFLKSMQPANSTGINQAGAPSRGVPVSEINRWIYAPIVEYDSQSNEVIRNGNSEAEVVKTVAFGGNRVRIIGTHETDASPFFQFNNRMENICRLLRSENYDAVWARMNHYVTSGSLPKIEEPDTKASGKEVTDDFSRRLDILITAYQNFELGRLDPATKVGRKNMSQFMLTDRDIATFRRYKKYLEELQAQAANDPYAKARYTPRYLSGVLEKKLRYMAQRWSQDINAKTIVMDVAK